MATDISFVGVLGHWLEISLQTEEFYALLISLQDTTCCDAKSQTCVCLRISLGLAAKTFEDRQ